MEHFVTLFDQLFLPQGIALHRSMERHVRSFTLWILCVDSETYDILSNINLNNVRLLKLGEWETAELLSVKPIRSKGEYCWTVTPFAPRFVFAADESIHRVTYIDADLWFRGDPTRIFAEFDASGAGVLITDHAYAPEYDASAVSGQYCVQFMTFSRHKGEAVRKWWEDRCVEWCFARSEDGKLGDQKYLDDWPDRFGNAVHVLEQKEFALGPWNATRFPYSAGVFFHFHGLRLTSTRSANLGGYPLPRPLIQHVYIPYVNDLRAAISSLEMIGIPFMAQSKSINLMRKLYRRLFPGFTLLKTLTPSGYIKF
jgi:hypothetical protein